MYTNRFYRSWVESDLISFEAKLDETDLFVLAQRELKKETLNLIARYRQEIKEYIRMNPRFMESLTPMGVDKNAPDIIKSMMRSSGKAGVGPMAAVAGAIAEFVGKGLLGHTKELIVENGGDIFIKSFKDRNFSLFAGDSPLSGKIGILIKADKTPLGVCTSSGTVGHSLSFGKADAVCVLAKDTSLSDAAATAICNSVKSKEMIEKGLDLSKRIEGVLGCVIIVGDKIGSVGEVELI